MILDRVFEASWPIENDSFAMLSRWEVYVRTFEEVQSEPFNVAGNDNLKAPDATPVGVGCTANPDDAECASRCPALLSHSGLY